MAISGFQHLNIRCAESEMPAIEKFYGEVLGLKTGARPNFPFAGLWLYDGDDPIVHVSARFPKGSIVKDLHSGSVDHIDLPPQFLGAGLKRLDIELRPRLRQIGGDHRHLLCQCA